MTTKHDQASDKRDAQHEDGLRLQQQYRLDAPVAKVWRAISIPALREAWLPGQDLASAEPSYSAPGREIRYTLRERQPPFIESEVAMQLEPTPDGGTLLTIIHTAGAGRQAANDSPVMFMRAA